MKTYETLAFIDNYLNGNNLKKIIKIEEYIKYDKVCIEIYKLSNFDYDEIQKDKKIIENLIEILHKNENIIVYEFHINEEYSFSKYFNCKFEIAISK